MTEEAPTDTEGETVINRIDPGLLDAARSAGAHDQFLAFVSAFPDSGVAETLETAVSMDALDEFEGFAGSFEASLWRDGAKQASNASPENARRIRALFPESEWPAWMQERAAEGEYDDEERLYTTLTVLEHVEEAEEFGLEPGTRFVTGGDQRVSHKARETEDGREFVLVAERVTSIDLYQPLSETEITDWCNSDVGKHVLAHYFENGPDPSKEWEEELGR